MRKLMLVLAAVACLVMVGCTSVQVTALDPATNVELICIENNPSVVVGDFLGALEDGIARHGKKTRVFSGAKPADCEYVLRYTALQSWDFTTFLSHAELRVYKDDRQIAQAIYHLKGKGGWSLAKWESTKIKMDPVIDKLLGYNAPPKPTH
jgi:hypothetical protein